MSDVKLHLRYPDSKPSDITDAYMRGVEVGRTLGTGTCHITDNGPWGYPYVCSACGASFDPDVNGGEFNYCPNCGAKAVDDG